MTVTIKRTVLFFAFCALMFTTSSSTTRAESGWVYHTSPTGLFSVRIPNEYNIKNERFPITENFLLQSGELVATIDQRPFKNVVKNYVVKYEQTLGTTLTNEEIFTLIDHDLDLYEEHYTALGGKLVERVKSDNDNGYYGLIHMTYEDEQLGSQGIKAYIYFSDMTKYQQIVTGADRIMFSLHSKDFFDSLSIRYGVAADEKKLHNSWVLHASPSSLFSIYLPPKSELYHPDEPYMESNESSEVISTSFSDPVRKQRLFYKVYGHRFDTDLSLQKVKAVLFSRHISNYLKDVRAVDFKQGYTADRTPFIEAEYRVPVPEKHPYVQAVKLRCLYTKKDMIVQETLGSLKLLRSPFVESLMKQVEFTPKAAAASDNSATQAQSAP